MTTTLSLIRVVDHLPVRDHRLFKAPLYKFLKGEHADQMLTFGRLRIGTLHEFREVERYAEDIGDKAEGLKNFLDPAHVVELDQPETHSKVLREVISLNDISGSRMVGVNTEVRLRSADFYIYCISRTFSEDAFDKVDYDACVAINNPYKFFSAIYESLHDDHRVTDWSIGSCVYGDLQELSYKWTKRKHHPALCKTSNLAYQNEARAIWRSSDKKINPVFLDCPAIIPYCDLHWTK